jgi:hypothetical protein
MKKFIKISLIILGLLLLTAYSASPQPQKAPSDDQGITTTPAKEEKDTSFPSKSSPGLYVNGWPVFTLSYPAHWLEQTPEAGQGFSAAASGLAPRLTVSVFPNSMPLEMATNFFIIALRQIGSDIRLIYDKPSKLKDGAPAQEAELEWVHKSGIKLNTLLLTANKDDIWIMITLSDIQGRIGDDLKSIAYSLRIKPGKEELAKVPVDIQEFLDGYCKDILSHDIEKVMHHFSDQFLNNGSNKKAIEDFIKKNILNIASLEINITGFESQENKADLAGFISVNSGKVPLTLSPITKENGQWKWYGNQR